MSDVVSDMGCGFRGRQAQAGTTGRPSIPKRGLPAEPAAAELAWISPEAKSLIDAKTVTPARNGLTGVPRGECDARSSQAPAADSDPDPGCDQDQSTSAVGTGASPATGWLSASGLSDAVSAGAGAGRG